VGLGILLFSTVSTPVLSPTQPSVQCILGASSLGLKRPERESHDTPPSAEIKNGCRYTSSLIRLHGVFS